MVIDLDNVAAEPTEQMIKSKFRSLDLDAGSEFCDRDRMYDHGAMMAPGGMLLAELMARQVELPPNPRILDLGCGRGQTTKFLAERFDAQVVGVDMWIAPEERVECSEASITHMQADIRRGLPVRAGSFDLVFSMQAAHTFAVSAAIMRYITKLIRPGGQLCIAQTCFDKESDPLPAVYQHTDGWDAGYQTYHSPGWWANHAEVNGGVEVTQCHELSDGKLYWEDHFLYEGERCHWDSERLKDWSWLMKQILFSQTSTPKLTHFLLTASVPAAAQTERKDEEFETDRWENEGGTYELSRAHKPLVEQGF